MTEIILNTLASLLECNSSQIAEALRESEAGITLDQLLRFHSKLCDIVVRDQKCMYCGVITNLGTQEGVVVCECCAMGEGQ